MTFLPYAPAGKGGDYLILVMDGVKHPFQRTEDGVLKIGNYEGGKEKKAKSFDELPLESHMEYMNCADAPTKAVPKVMTRLMRYIDRIRDECTIDIDNDCARTMFKVGDVDSNGKITPTEIKKGVAAFLLLGELAEHKTLSAADIEKAAARAKEEGGKLSASLMQTHDANKSGDLDYNEIVENFAAPPLPVIKETMLKIGRILPAFKIAAAALD